MILFDQGALPYDAEDIAALTNNTVGAVSFLKDKIKNLEITPAQLALDPCSGSCVITDTKTGELLALVSYPGYDNNRLANTVDAKYFASLNTDLSKPLYNYAYPGAYCTGFHVQDGFLRGWSCNRHDHTIYPDPGQRCL